MVALIVSCIGVKTFCAVCDLCMFSYFYMFSYFQLSLGN